MLEQLLGDNHPVQQLQERAKSRACFDHTSCEWFRDVERNTNWALHRVTIVLTVPDVRLAFSKIDGSPSTYSWRPIACRRHEGRSPSGCLG